uniref:AAA+ ATPase domain-containing protein n=1 Tax=Candidatus Kentrum sp. LFY TaxID=2126342 RepID=A0A450UYJ6_9GAMM|nr:MAG: hypothetical protein BECKLFY1418A_GA0070994_10717 [Candidatus Kentron sp. LFY]
MLAEKLTWLLDRFPCVCILGARQVGKTTLARMALPDASHVDLESASVRDRAELSPESFLDRGRSPLVLDEIQLFPSLMQAIKVAIDKAPDGNGRFVILGSASPFLLRQAAETLAGRVGFLDLDGVVFRECKTADPGLDLEESWVRGGYPRAAKEADAEARLVWLDAYVRTFIERDLPRMGIGVRPSLMHRFMMMIAHGHGGVWNASRFAAAAGVSYHTMNRYLMVLEAAFLVRILWPFHANVGKRFVKSPKVYLRDSGLYHYLMNLKSREEIESSPYCGQSWEGFCLEQIIRQGQAERLPPKYWFYRTQAGLEADLIVEGRAGRTAVEIKFGSRMEKRTIKNLHQVMVDTGCARGTVVYSGLDSYQVDDGVRVLSAMDRGFPEDVLAPWAK